MEIKSHGVTDKNIEELKKTLVNTIDNYTGKSIQDQILAQEKYNTYMMGSPEPINKSGLASVFSGSDIIGFFDGVIMELMACTIHKSSMRCTFALSDTLKPYMLHGKSLGWVPFHLIGVNEQGHKAMLAGECMATDFELVTSIDELNTEVIIHFTSQLNEMEGWLNPSEELNKKLGIKFLELRMQHFKQTKGEKSESYLKLKEIWDKIEHV